MNGRQDKECVKESQAHGRKRRLSEVSDRRDKASCGVGIGAAPLAALRLQGSNPSSAAKSSSTLDSASSESKRDACSPIPALPDTTASHAPLSAPPLAVHATISTSDSEADPGPDPDLGSEAVPAPRVAPHVGDSARQEAEQARVARLAQTERLLLQNRLEAAKRIVEEARLAFFKFPLPPTVGAAESVREGRFLFRCDVETHVEQMMRVFGHKKALHDSRFKYYGAHVFKDMLDAIAQSATNSFRKRAQNEARYGVLLLWMAMVRALITGRFNGKKRSRTPEIISGRIFSYRSSKKLAFRNKLVDVLQWLNDPPVVDLQLDTKDGVIRALDGLQFHFQQLDQRQAATTTSAARADARPFSLGNATARTAVARTATNAAVQTVQAVSPVVTSLSRILPTGAAAVPSSQGVLDLSRLRSPLVIRQQTQLHPSFTLCNASPCGSQALNIQQVKVLPGATTGVGTQGTLQTVTLLHLNNAGAALPSLVRAANVAPPAAMAAPMSQPQQPGTCNNIPRLPPFLERDTSPLSASVRHAPHSSLTGSLTWESRLEDALAERDDMERRAKKYRKQRNEYADENSRLKTENDNLRRIMASLANHSSSNPSIT